MALTPDDCREYLESLEMGEELVRRGLRTTAAVQRFLPADPDHIFVCEHRDEEGKRRAGSLWLLGADYMSEAFRFVTESEFDIARLDDGVTRIVVSRQAFDFDQAGERSQLAVVVNLGPTGNRIGCTFKATGRNCLTLQGVLESYLAPLLFVTSLSAPRARTG